MDICICQRLFARNTIRILDGVMADNVGALLLQDRTEFTITNINCIETCSGINCFWVPMYKVINDQHIMSSVQIGSGQMRTDETSAACNSYLHRIAPFSLLESSLARRIVMEYTLF